MTSSVSVNACVRPHDNTLPDTNNCVSCRTRCSIYPSSSLPNCTGGCLTRLLCFHKVHLIVPVSSISPFCLSSVSHLPSHVSLVLVEGWFYQVTVTWTGSKDPSTLLSQLKILNGFASSNNMKLMPAHETIKCVSFMFHCSVASSAPRSCPGQQGGGFE